MPLQTSIDQNQAEIVGSARERIQLGERSETPPFAANCQEPNKTGESLQRTPSASQIQRLSSGQQQQQQSSLPAAKDEAVSRRVESPKEGEGGQDSSNRGVELQNGSAQRIVETAAPSTHASIPALNVASKIETVDRTPVVKIPPVRVGEGEAVKKGRFTVLQGPNLLTPASVVNGVGGTVTHHVMQSGGENNKHNAGGEAVDGADSLTSSGPPLVQQKGRFQVVPTASDVPTRNGVVKAAAVAEGTTAAVASAEQTGTKNPTVIKQIGRFQVLATGADPAQNDITKPTTKTFASPGGTTSIEPRQNAALPTEKNQPIVGQQKGRFQVLPTAPDTAHNHGATNATEVSANSAGDAKVVADTIEELSSSVATGTSHPVVLQKGRFQVLASKTTDGAQRASVVTTSADATEQPSSSSVNAARTNPVQKGRFQVLPATPTDGATLSASTTPVVASEKTALSAAGGPAIVQKGRFQVLPPTATDPVTRSAATKAVEVGLSSGGAASSVDQVEKSTPLSSGTSSPVVVQKGRFQVVPATVDASIALPAMKPPEEVQSVSSTGVSQQGAEKTPSQPVVVQKGRFQVVPTVTDTTISRIPAPKAEESSQSSSGVGASVVSATSQETAPLPATPEACLSGEKSTQTMGAKGHQPPTQQKGRFQVVPSSVDRIPSKVADAGAVDAMEKSESSVATGAGQPVVTQKGRFRVTSADAGDANCIARGVRERQTSITQGAPQQGASALQNDGIQTLQQKPSSPIAQKPEDSPQTTRIKQGTSIEKERTRSQSPKLAQAQHSTNPTQISNNQTNPPRHHAPQRASADAMKRSSSSEHIANTETSACKPPLHAKTPHQKASTVHAARPVSKAPLSFDNKGVGSSLGLGKVLYFLDQMKQEVTEADRTIKTLQSDAKFLRDKNKELEARCREMERRWNDEKAKVKSLKKKVKELKAQGIAQDESHSTGNEQDKNEQRQYAQSRSNSLDHVEGVSERSDTPRQGVAAPEERQTIEGKPFDPDGQAQRHEKQSHNHANQLGRVASEGSTEKIVERIEQSLENMQHNGNHSNVQNSLSSVSTVHHSGSRASSSDSFDPLWASVSAKDPAAEGKAAAMAVGQNTMLNGNHISMQVQNGSFPLQTHQRQGSLVINQNGLMPAMKGIPVVNGMGGMHHGTNGGLVHNGSPQQVQPMMGMNQSPSFNNMQLAGAANTNGVWSQAAQFSQQPMMQAQAPMNHQILQQQAQQNFNQNQFVQQGMPQPTQAFQFDVFAQQSTAQNQQQAPVWPGPS